MAVFSFWRRRRRRSSSPSPLSPTVVLYLVLVLLVVLLIPRRGDSGGIVAAAAAAAYYAAGYVVLARGNGGVLRAAAFAPGPPRRCWRRRRRPCRGDEKARATTTVPPLSSTTEDVGAAAVVLGGDSNATSTVRKNPSWFASRIQDAMDYGKSVERLYVRQVVTETEDVARLALRHYERRLLLVRDDAPEDDDSSNDDPFGETARMFSADGTAAQSGGTVGWVPRPEGGDGDDEEILDEPPSSSLLPRDVLRQLFETIRPKAGDCAVLRSAATRQWHLVHVSEVWLRQPFQDDGSVAVINDDDDEQQQRIGSFVGRNLERKRGKLKGHGSLPEFPTSLRTYSIQTSGCQMNVADSERLSGVLQHELGMTELLESASEDSGAAADVVLFNTCSIRDKAEQKLYDALGPYASRKRAGDRLALVVTGCVAQQEGEALMRRVPEVDAVIGPQYVPFLKTVLERVGLGQQVVATAPMLIAEDTDFTQKPVRGHDVRAWVNVIYGCNEHCTYCVVPGTRGMEQSRSLQAILDECLDLASRGYREVTLLGQNIDAFGRDMVPKRTFAELLEFLNARLPDGMRIRYVTSHPRYFGSRVVDAVANLDKVCECFHMPFQAGDDGVLKRMRRGYSYDSYMQIIRRIREMCPDAAITADCIVGFPGESEEAFQKTLQLMEEVKFDNLNSFCYSPRPNTEAALWDDQVPDDVKAERLQRVQKLAARHGLERSRRYLGRTVEVLVEDRNPRNAKQVMGRTRQGRQVFFDGDLETLRGELVDVKVTEARTWSLMGEPVAGH